MFSKSEGKVGTREYACIILLAVGIKFADTTPTLLFKACGNAGWIVAFTSGIVAAIGLIVLLILLKRYNLGLIDIIYRLTGKYVGFILGMLLFFPRFIFAVVNSRSYVDILNEVFFPRTPIFALLLVLVCTSYFLASRGFEAIGRTAYIIQPYIVVVLGLLVILAMKQLNYKYIFPIAGKGVNSIIKQSFYYSSIYEETMQLAVFFPMVRGYKEIKLGSLIGIGISVFAITIFCFIYITVFDNPPVQVVNYLFQSLTRILYSQRFISNLEGVFLFFWAMGSIVRFSVHIYLCAAFFAYTLRLNEFKPFLIPMTALIIILGMIPDNMYSSVLMIRRILLNINWAFIYFLPVALLCISQLKGDYKKETQ